MWLRGMAVVMISGLVLLRPAWEAAGPAATAAPTPRAGARNEADIQVRLAAYAPVRLSVDLAGLSSREKAALAKMVAAVAAIDPVFWKQMGRAAIEARAAFANATDPVDRLYRDFIAINYGPFDLRDNDARFIEAGGNGPRIPGAGYYPEDMTREEFEARLAAHPERRAEFEKPTTLIRRVDGVLVAIPYETLYEDELEQASRALKEAAAEVDHAGLRRYLSLRSEALLSGDTYASDLAWLDLKDHPIDIIIGPMETDTDGLMGLKAAYEGAVLVRDARMSRSLEVYRDHLEAMAEHLPVEERLRQLRPVGAVEVVNVVRFAGEFNAGIKTVAASLPTDERILARKGARKQIYRNVLEAKFEAILQPLARAVLPQQDRALITREAFVNNVILHELSHTIGPETVAGTAGTVRRALRDHHAAIEEAKADILGIQHLRYLRDQEIFTDEEVQECRATWLVGLLRGVRFGSAGPHGRAAALQLYVMMRDGGIELDAKKGEFAVNPRKLEPAVARLVQELLKIQGTGDYGRAGALLQVSGQLAPGVVEAIRKTAAVPVDVRLEYPM